MPSWQLLLLSLGHEPSNFCRISLCTYLHSLSLHHQSLINSFIVKICGFNELFFLFLVPYLETRIILLYYLLEHIVLIDTNLSLSFLEKIPVLIKGIATDLHLFSVATSRQFLIHSFRILTSCWFLPQIGPVNANFNIKF